MRYHLTFRPPSNLPSGPADATGRGQPTLCLSPTAAQLQVEKHVSGIHKPRMDLEAVLSILEQLFLFCLCFFVLIIGEQQFLYLWSFLMNI